MTNEQFYNQLYCFKSSYSTKNYTGKIINDKGGWGKLLRNEFEIGSLSIVHLEGGQKPKDIFWNEILSPFCVSSEIKELFIKNEVTGIQFIPVEVKTKSGDKSDSNYFAVTISGRADSINYFRSKVVFETSPSGKLVPEFKGLFFDEKSWDGSDFFMTREDKYGHYTAEIFVTQKVKDLFIANKIKQVEFDSFNNHLTPCSNIFRLNQREFNRRIKRKVRKSTPTIWLIKKKLYSLFRINNKYDLL